MKRDLLAVLDVRFPDQGPLPDGPISFTTVPCDSWGRWSCTDDSYTCTATCGGALSIACWKAPAECTCYAGSVEVARCPSQTQQITAPCEESCMVALACCRNER